MENIRCLLADIHQVVLADIIQKTIETHDGIEVIGLVENNNDLLERLDKEPVDVVIHNITDINGSHSMNDVFRLHPKTMTVGLMDNGRSVCFCIQDIGLHELLGMIKETKIHISRNQDSV